MVAGQEYSIFLELNFNDTNAAKDWSVVAWGEKGGNMSITVDGMTSDEGMPLARTDGEEQESEEEEEEEKKEEEEEEEEEKEEDKDEDEGSDPRTSKSEAELKWDGKLARLHTRVTEGTNCKVGYREKYNWDNNSWDTLFKIDCPDGNDQYFDFKML